MLCTRPQDGSAVGAASILVSQTTQNVYRSSEQESCPVFPTEEIESAHKIEDVDGTVQSIEMQGRHFSFR